MNLSMVSILWSIIAMAGLPGELALRQKHFRLNSEHVALNGYDPVSYFQFGPIKGKQSISSDLEGVTYFFSNEANKNTFVADPSKYEPAWGGWCGHAMAIKGEKVEINPLCFKIIQGRNVLFYKTIWTNALTNWEKDIKTIPENTLMQKGADYWNGILKK